MNTYCNDERTKNGIKLAKKGVAEKKKTRTTMCLLKCEENIFAQETKSTINPGEGGHTAARKTDDLEGTRSFIYSS